MVNREIIRRRLQSLDEYLQILQHYRDYDLDAFVADPERYGSAERFLQLAIEVTIDIGNHIVAGQRLGSIEKSRDLPLLFGKHGIIDEKQVERWIRMIGFRNILVHEYAEVDRRIVYQVLTEELGDFTALRRAFAAFL